MRIAICDDDNEFRGLISDYLQPYKEKYPEITESNFCCGEDLISAYAKGQQFDILFLDIQMKDFDGVETAKIIRETDSNAIIIFITSFVSFVSDTFRVGAFQFLMKPLKQAAFNIDFERAIERYKINHYKYSVKWKDVTSAFEISDIYFIEASNRHLVVYTQDEMFEYVGKISEEADKLKSYNILKCHQSYLVNFRHIKRIDNNKIYLSNRLQIPISRHLKVRIKAAFNDFILGCSV